MKKYRYLIIGGSVAAIAAVEGIRSIDGKGSICIISHEPYHAYSRPMISNYLMDEIDLEKMYYRPLSFYEREEVECLLGREVVKVEPEKRTVELENGERLSYEKLLIASGGRPIVPRIEGVDRKGVYNFLTLDNAREIKSSFGEVERVVIIGGGLSGMKAAEALCCAGKEVTVVEMLPRVLAPVYDETACRMITHLFREKGVEILTSSQAEEIYGRSGDERVGGVRLKDGREVPADIVILTVGVLPQVGFLSGSGIEVNRGIVVDEGMRTNVEDVYAAGDVAECFDILLGERRLIPISPKAYYEGRIAGINMAGGKAQFRGTFAMNSADFFGLPTMSAGIVNPEGEGWESLVDCREGERYYRRIILKDNKVKGMIMIGDAVDKAGVVLGLIKEQVDVRGFKERIVARDFDLIDLPKPIRMARIRDVALI